MDPATITAIAAAGATIFGGVGVEVIRKILSRSSSKEDYATVMRNELRGEIKDLKTEIDSLQTELEEYRIKTIDLMKEAVRYSAEIERLKLMLERAQFIQEDRLNDNSTRITRRVPPVEQDD